MPPLARLRRLLAERGSPAQHGWRAVLVALALAAAATVHWADGSHPSATQLLEEGARDLMLRVLSSSREDTRVAIVDIDERSLQRLGPWPWPRERLAELAERLLTEVGASRVAFDMVMTDRAARRGTGDARLAALAREGAVVAAQAFDYQPRDTAMTVGAVAGALPGALPALPARTANATGHIGNFAELAQARCTGNIGFVPDADGKIRRIAPLTVWQGRAYPTLALATLACARQPVDVGLLASWLPMDAGGFWRVPFTRDAQSYVSVSAADVLAGRFDLGGQAATSATTTSASSPLAGRLVLVGSSAMGLADRVATPLSNSTSGVTVHAAALSWLLDAAAEGAPMRPPAWAMPLWASGSILALGWSVSGARARLRRMLATAAAVTAGWVALAGWMAATGVAQPVSSALAGYAIVLLVQLPLEWSWAQARMRHQARLLSRYVAPSVLTELMRAPDANPLAPRQAQITVLIADMQDYTLNTANSSLNEAARLTKGFLEALTKPVLEHRGTLDRYTGDGLVAFWGAPIADADHADRAVDAALEILAQVDAFNRRRRVAGLRPVTVRMGLASGSALVGDLGTPFRISYTAVGDCINLASRLQQASREAGVNILAAETVAQGCRRRTLLPLGHMAVRGLPDQEVFTVAAARGRPGAGAARRAGGSPAGADPAG